MGRDTQCASCVEVDMVTPKLEVIFKGDLLLPNAAHFTLSTLMGCSTTAVVALI
jgi:hypothetical protein